MRVQLVGKVIQWFLLAIVAVLLLSVSAAQAENRTFSWIPNDEAENVVGYKIHYGTSRHNYTHSVDIGNPPVVGGRMIGVVTGLDEKKIYYFAATAYSATAESDPSREVKVIGSLWKKRMIHMLILP